MKLKFTILSLLFIASVIKAQTSSDKNTYQEIVAQTDEIFDRLVEIRRDLHVHPEISKQEKKTSQKIASYLKNIGLEVKMNIGGYGVVGILKGGKQGKKIAWRADIDAIKTTEPDVVSFPSKNKGVRHICGHDVHTTIALGLATILTRQKHNLRGTVYFIFQPAEETFTGAKDMIEDGLFEIIQPDEIYGLHIGPEKSGVISYKANELFAYQKTLKVTFKPTGNKKELASFMNKVLKGFDRNPIKGTPWETIHNITDTEKGIANKKTIYKDYFFRSGTKLYKDQNTLVYTASFFETNRKKMLSIPLKIKQQIVQSKFKDLLVSVAYLPDYSGTPINDPKLTEVAKQTIEGFYNKEMLQPLYGQVPYFGEDFIYYQQKVPGVFFFLGGSNIEKGIKSMPHTPNFAVDENTIKYGVQSFSMFILKRINNTI